MVSLHKYRARLKGGPQAPGLGNFVPAVAYYSCQALPVAPMQSWAPCPFAYPQNCLSAELFVRKTALTYNPLT